MNATAVPIEFLGWSILPVIDIGDIASGSCLDPFAYDILDWISPPKGVGSAQD